MIQPNVAHSAATGAWAWTVLSVRTSLASISSTSKQNAGRTRSAVPRIQQLVGALNAQRASKGVFVTTSTFSREATDLADNVNPRVILVDGQELSEEALQDLIAASPRRRSSPTPRCR